MKKLEKYKVILIPGLMIVSFLMYLGSWIVSIGFRADEILDSYDYWEELDDALYLYVDSITDENAVNHIVDIFRDGKLSLRELSRLLGYMTDAPGYQGLSVLTHILVIAVPILLVASIALFLLKKKWGVALYFIGEAMTMVTVIAFLQKLQVEFLGISASGIISVIVAFLALIACFVIPDSEASVKEFSMKDFSVKNISLEGVKQKAASAASAAVSAAETGYGEVKEQVLKYKETHETQKTAETYETSGNKKVQAPLFCPNCGSKLQPGAKFCSICGQPVTSLKFETVPEDYGTVSDACELRTEDYETGSDDYGTGTDACELRTEDHGTVSDACETRSDDYELRTENYETGTDYGGTVDTETPEKTASAMSDNKDVPISEHMDASPFESANSSTAAGMTPEETEKAAVPEEIEPAVTEGAEVPMPADEKPTASEKMYSDALGKTGTADPEMADMTHSENTGTTNLESAATARPVKAEAADPGKMDSSAPEKEAPSARGTARTESRLNFGKGFRPDYNVPSSEERMKNLFHRPE